MNRGSISKLKNIRKIHIVDIVDKLVILWTLSFTAWRTVPTLVPGMVAATPNSLDGTQKELGPKSGRSPEALDWHSCDSSDSMEAAHLQRVQKFQNSTPSDDLVDSRSPQHKGIRMSLPLLAACHFAGF